MNNDSLMVNEIFFSIDGEGKRAGELAAFIRLMGCNLRCSYCDTAYAFHNGESMTVEEIAEKVKPYRNITLTGGEPLEQDLHSLLKALREHDVNIETNGSKRILGYLGYENVFFTLDYKCPTSNMEKKMEGVNFAFLRPRDVLKFVVGSVEDLMAAKKICYINQPKCRVYISPVFGKIEPAEIVGYMKENKCEDWRIQLQLHKYIWNPNERGV